MAIPLQELENHLRTFAVPGKHGSIRIRVLVHPEAAHEVGLDVQRRTITDVPVASERVSVIASNDRYYRVRDEVRSHAQDFRLSCPIAEVVCHFHDGFLKKWEVIDYETRSA